MEFALNLVWACTALAILTAVYRKAASARIGVPSAMLLAILLCLILLPAISLTDDILAARQATLPLSGQTWRLLADDVAPAVLLAVTAWLLLLISLFAENQRLRLPSPRQHILSARLIRALRLRPPPCAA